MLALPWSCLGLGVIINRQRGTRLRKRKQGSKKPLSGVCVCIFEVMFVCLASLRDKQVCGGGEQDTRSQDARHDKNPSRRDKTRRALYIFGLK